MAAGYRSSKIGQTSRNDGAQIPRSVDTDLHPCPSAVITRVTVRTATGLNWQPSTLLLTPARPVCNAREGLVPKDRRLKFGVTSGLLITSKTGGFSEFGQKRAYCREEWEQGQPKCCFHLHEQT